MITNKVGRAEAEISYLPARNFLRIAASRPSGPRGRSHDVGAGRGKKRENIYTDDRGSRRIARWGGQGRAKGKDLNGLSQKAFSYSPWQTTMAKWREREHILNRFPSSVRRDVFMWRTKPAPARPGCCMYIPPRCSRRGLASSFGGGSFEFKRFKAISQEGGASDCRPSNTDRPTTLPCPRRA